MMSWDSSRPEGLRRCGAGTRDACPYLCGGHGATALLGGDARNHQTAEWFYTKLPNGFTPNCRTKCPQTAEQKVRKLPNGIALLWDIWHNGAMRNYKKRVVDDLLARKLRGMGAMLVQGAKWCGKTTTCEEFAKSALYMADPYTKETNIKMADWI